jgi:hypothetical protein
MTTLSPNFSRYLQGEPLTEELEALRAGRIPEPPMRRLGSEAAQLPAEGVSRPLTRADRVLLRELRASEGWPVLIRLFKRAVDREEKTAIVNSKVEPLTRANELAALWARVAIYEKLAAEAEALVDGELEALDAGEQGS